MAGSTFDWIGPADGLWSDPSNWRVEGLLFGGPRAPGLGDTAQFGTGTSEVAGGGSASELYVPTGGHVVFDTAGARYFSVVTNIDAGGSLALNGAWMQGEGLLLSAGGVFDVSRAGVESGSGNPVEPVPLAADFESISLDGGATSPELILGANSIGTVELNNGDEGSGNAYDPAADISGSGSIYLPEGAAPLPLVSPSSLNFGIVHVGQQVTLALTIKNQPGGGSPLIGTFKTTGITSPDISATSQDFSIPSGDTGTLAVTLTGIQAGSLAGNAVDITAQFGLPATTSASLFANTATVPVTGEVLNDANPTFVLYTNDPNAVQSDTAPGHHLINLGNVTQGTVLGAMYLVVGNSVAGPADTVTAQSVDAASSAFIESHHVGVSGLQAGISAAVEQINLSTANTGAVSDTIVQIAYGSNASGYVGSPEVTYTTVVANIVPHA